MYDDNDKQPMATGEASEWDALTREQRANALTEAGYYIPPTMPPEPPRGQPSKADRAEGPTNTPPIGRGQSSLEALESFLKTIQTRRYEPLATGLTDLDNALGGGLMRQTLVILSAAPGIGKTAMAQQIAEGYAKDGADVIFVNYEMSTEQLLARSLARIIAINECSMSPAEIMQGYKWTPEQRNLVMLASDEYRKTIAPTMRYNPAQMEPDLDTLLNYLDAEAIALENQGRRSPIVVIDYLQLIHGAAGEDAASTLKRAVAGLKDFAIRHDAIVIGICAQNRPACQSGEATMWSGRDSSALEYSADTMLAMTYSACLERNGQPAKRPDQLNDEEKNLRALKLVKARMGAAVCITDLYFDGEAMRFTRLVR